LIGKTQAAEAFLTIISRVLAMLPTLWTALMARARPLLASLRDSLSAEASKWRATPAATKRKWLMYAAAAAAAVVAAAVVAAATPWLVSTLTAPPAYRQTQDVFEEAVRAAQEGGGAGTLYSPSAHSQVKLSPSWFIVVDISRCLCSVRELVAWLTPRDSCDGNISYRDCSLPSTNLEAERPKLTNGAMDCVPGARGESRARPVHAGARCARVRFI
jgi:hypothetical protein